VTSSEADRVVVAFARELADLRRKWGLSVDDLAEILSIGARTLRAWESGKKTPSSTKLIRWADALGYDFELKFRG
jgi:DNA-binding transcriptional regulator YiaG